MAHNAGLDGDALVETTLQLCALELKVRCPLCQSCGLHVTASVRSTLPASVSVIGNAHARQAKFGLEFSESWVVELDSSTPTKFSRHVIVNIPGAAFQSNAHVGAFVKDMVCAGQAAAEPGSQHDNERPCPQLLVNKVR